MATPYQQEANIPVDEERNERFAVRVSETEKRKFEKLAKQRHTDLSELVRQLLHKEADNKNGREA